MEKIEEYNIVKAMIELIDDLPVGCEALEGYLDTKDIHETWQKFKGEY